VSTDKTDLPVHGAASRATRLDRPEWLKVRLNTTGEYEDVRRMMRRLSLVTVCEEARCPNIHECWARERTATFMLMGDVCTRHCGFCAVGKGKPGALDPEEPERVAEAAAELGLTHAVVTSVNRDDLPDGGAAHFAATIGAIRARKPEMTVEVLIPDFQGDAAALETVLDAAPEILNHNMETVARLYRRVRPDAGYAQSLALLRRAADRRDREGLALRTKSGLMVGLGETFDEVLRLLEDLRAAGCDIATIGQYLQPHARRLPIERYWTPAEFDDLRRAGEAMGFLRVESGPLVRSSYHARRALEGPAA
jgi:lipoic acid synthetase